MRPSPLKFFLAKLRHAMYTQADLQFKQTDGVVLGIDCDFTSPAGVGILKIWLLNSKGMLLVSYSLSFTKEYVAALVAASMDDAIDLRAREAIDLLYKNWQEKAAKPV